MREQQRVGLDCLRTATELLRRVRTAHPTAGLYEAADVNWWWRMPRSTDTLPQLFWFDRRDRPEAAVITTDWGDRVALDTVVMPGASPDVIAGVVHRGLAHAAALGFTHVGTEVDRTDDVTRDVLTGHDFDVAGDGVVETWLTAAARPRVAPLAPGYRLSSRADAARRSHPMADRNGPGVEARLRQTPLYRPELDLAVHDDRDQVAAYGLFWYDPATATGLVEPMRTEEEHRRRGLARHVLTRGVALLAAAGATRIKICYEPANPPARDLYLGTGFRPLRETVVMTGPTVAA